MVHRPWSGRAKKAAGLLAGPGWVGYHGGFPGVEAFVNHNPSSGHTLVALSDHYVSALPLMETLPVRFSKSCGDARSA